MSAIFSRITKGFALAIALTLPTISYAQANTMQLNAPVKVTKKEGVVRGLLVSIGDSWVIIDQGEKGLKAIPVSTIVDIWQAPEAPEE